MTPTRTSCPLSCPLCIFSSHTHTPYTTHRRGRRGVRCHFCRRRQPEEEGTALAVRRGGAVRVCMCVFTCACSPCMHLWMYVCEGTRLMHTLLSSLFCNHHYKIKATHSRPPLPYPNQRTNTPHSSSITFLTCQPLQDQGRPRAQGAGADG